MNGIQYFRTCVVVDEGQPNIPESHILRVVFASHYDAALAREAALREDLSMQRNIITGQRKSLDVCAEQITALQQRLTASVEDAKRLDFIEAQGVSIGANLFAGGFCGPRGKEWSAFKYARNFAAYGEKLRDAIDAASDLHLKGKTDEVTHG